MQKFLMAVAAATSLSACVIDDGKDATSTDESNVIGGTYAGFWGYVFKLRVGSNNCTATLISPSTFLTAGRCLDFAFPATTGTATFLDGTTRSVTLAFSPSQTTGHTDVAVGRLSSPVTQFTPAVVAGTEPIPNYGDLTVIGYGCNFDRTAGCGPSTRTYKSYGYTGADTYNYSWGDFGAPTFIGDINTLGALVRVADGWDSDTGADVGADPMLNSNVTTFNAALTTPGVGYVGYVQNQGWQRPWWDGGMAGTTGQSLRLEGLRVWSNGSTDHVSYTAFVQNQGWQTEVCDAKLGGTTGQSLRMEAIKIRETRNGATKNIEYRTNLQGIGWTAWTSNNAVSGTTGQSRRIEAIEIQNF